MYLPWYLPNEHLSPKAVWVEQRLTPIFRPIRTIAWHSQAGI